MMNKRFIPILIIWHVYQDRNRDWVVVILELCIHHCWVMLCNVWRHFYAYAKCMQATKPQKRQSCTY